MTSNSTPTPTREEKIQFFSNLSQIYSSDHLNDDDLDILGTNEPPTTSRASSVVTSATGSAVGRKRSLEESKSSPKPKRKLRKVDDTSTKSNASTSTPQSGSNNDSEDDVVFMKSTRLNRPSTRETKSDSKLPTTAASSLKKRANGLERRKTEPFEKAETPTTGPKKNKKGERMIFDGLTFYYVPNDLKNPVRKKRIIRAQELGAAWASELGDNVTHLMVDKSYNWEQMLKFLKVTDIPAGITVANVEYQGACIDAGKMKMPIEKRFLVSKPQQAPARPPSPAPAPKQALKPKLSLHSLPLKQKKVTKEVQPESQVHDAEDEATSTHTTPDDESNKIVDTKKDALTEFIVKSKNMEDATKFLDPESDEEDEPTGKGGSVVPGNKKYKFESHFLCNKGPAKEANGCPNARTIEILEKMLKYYEDMNDQWRIIAYRKAISILKSQKVKICTAKEAKKFFGIGQRLADKIEEIVEKDSLERLQYALDDPHYATLSLFLKIYGAGLAQAKAWIAQGHRTTADLLKHAKLSKHQRIGIEHLEDFETRIPRAEVAEHGEVVRACLKEMDPELKMEIMGSYRRGKADCGDIDIMVTHPTLSASELHNVLEDLLSRLMKSGFLKADMTSSRKADGMVMHGASQLSPDKPWRRLDILMVPNECVGAALLYFTGDDIFNRSIRLLARKKGLKLNQNGLWRGRVTDKNSKVICEGTRVVSGPDERDIFKALGVEWREPHERIYH